MNASIISVMAQETASAPPEPRFAPVSRLSAAVPGSGGRTVPVTPRHSGTSRRRSTPGAALPRSPANARPPAPGSAAAASRSAAERQTGEDDEHAQEDRIAAELVEAPGRRGWGLVSPLVDPDPPRRAELGWATTIPTIPATTSAVPWTGSSTVAGSPADQEPIVPGDTAISSVWARRRHQEHEQRVADVDGTSSPCGTGSRRRAEPPPAAARPPADSDREERRTETRGQSADSPGHESTFEFMERRGRSGRCLQRRRTGSVTPNRPVVCQSGRIRPRTDLHDRIAKGTGAR